jgi:hypothetical protein
VPKQDKVQIINQRRRKPTDSLGLGQAIIGGGPGDPATITLETDNSSGATHTHKLEVGALVSIGHIVLIQAATGELVDYGVADDDGLTAALAAATDGDVVSLPVGVLAGDFEIPADVTVVGMGLNTVLTGTITGDGLLLNVQRSLDYAGQIISTADHAWLGDTVMRDLDPDGDNLWRLGDDGLRWAQAWINYLDVQDVSISATLDVEGTTNAADILPQATGTYELGSDALRWQKLWVNEFTFSEIDGDLIPTLTDTYDIGSASKLWRRGYLSELDTFLLVENAISVIGGIQVIGHGQGTLAVALGDGVDDTQIDVGEGTNLAAGDFVLLRASLAVEYLEIVSDDGDGLFTVDRDVDGSGRNTWPQGAVWVNLGQTGDGRIELAASTTPRISIALQGAAYNLSDEIVRIGDLNGSFGVSEERYGFGVGDYAAGNYLRYDPTDGFLLRAGDGEVRIDETGIMIGYDAAAAFRLEADAGGTKHDVMYHDDGADALHIESATQYWELKEYQGAKWAMDGDFVKGQARSGSASMDLALGNAANNWGMLSAHSAPGVILSVGTGSTPTQAVDWREHRLIPSADNARRPPLMVWVGAETDATKYLDFLAGVKYLWANLAAFNVDTGAAIAHCVCEIAQPGSGNTDRYFTSDRDYLYSTSGDLYLRLRNDGFAILYNTSAADVRWVGWVMYFTA